MIQSKDDVWIVFQDWLHIVFGRIAAVCSGVSFVYSLRCFFFLQFFLVFFTDLVFLLQFFTAILFCVLFVDWTGFCCLI